MKYYLLTILTVLLTSPAIVESEVLYRRYVTTSSAEIPIDEVRTNCQGGTLVSTLGQPLRPTDGVKLNIVLSEENQSCIPRNRVMTQFALKLKGFEIAECYRSSTCKGVRWSSADMAYRCGSDSMALELQLYCELNETVSLSSATAASISIPRNRERCEDGRLKTASHAFMTSTCLQPLHISTERKNKLLQLVQELNACRGGCREVSLSGYSLPNHESCESGAGGRATTYIRVYWTCEDTPTGQLYLTTAEPTAGSGASTDFHKTVTANGSKAKSEASHASSANQGSHDTQEIEPSRETAYLIALVIVSVLLLLTILMIVAIFAYFLKIKGRWQKRLGKEVRSGPPSRQALYSTVDEAVRLCEDQERPNSCNSSMRYVARDSMKDAKVNDGAYSEYSIPLGENYSPPEEDDTYEVVDTMASNKVLSTPQRNGSDKYSYGYMIPVKSVKPPPRKLSEKYANGYLLPTVSKHKV